MTLKINATGFILHAYVNGEYLGKILESDLLMYLNYLLIALIACVNFYFIFLTSVNIGSEWAKYNDYNYVFEKNVKLNPGKNVISLLSATVGFPVRINCILVLRSIRWL